MDRVNSAKTTNKKRITWIELLRIAACIGVIGIHAGAQHFRDTPLDSGVWRVSNFYHGINRFAVASFIMISGALYLDSKRNWSLKKLWSKNILQIAAAYIFWQIFYAIYRIVMAGDLASGPGTVFRKILIYCSSSYFHLWYLPMLVGLLIVTPLLWEIVNCERGRKWEEYLILLFLIIKIIPYTVNCFSFPEQEYVMNLLYTVQPGMVIDYAGYFILGHYLSHYEIPKKLEKTVYILGVVLIIAAILLSQYMSPRVGRELQSYYENFTLAGFFWGSAVFLFFKNYVSRIQWTEKQEEIICRLGGYTFGIYLVHAFFRDILRRAGVNSMMIGCTVIAIPMVMICIFVLSCIAVILIKKIPVLGKWIV